MRSELRLNPKPWQLRTTASTLLPGCDWGWFTNSFIDRNSADPKNYDACGFLWKTGCYFLASPQGPWPNHGGGLENRREAPIGSKVSKSNVNNLALKWKFNASNEITATPAIADGVIYFPVWTDGNVYAVNAASGKLRLCALLNRKAWKVNPISMVVFFWEKVYLFGSYRESLRVAQEFLIHKFWHGQFGSSHLLFPISSLPLHGIMIYSNARF